MLEWRRNSLGAKALLWRNRWRRKGRVRGREGRRHAWRGASRGNIGALEKKLRDRRQGVDWRCAAPMAVGAYRARVEHRVDPVAIKRVVELGHEMMIIIIIIFMMKVIGFAGIEESAFRKIIVGLVAGWSRRRESGTLKSWTSGVTEKAICRPAVRRRDKLVRAVHKSDRLRRSKFVIGLLKKRRIFAKCKQYCNCLFFFCVECLLEHWWEVIVEKVLQILKKKTIAKKKKKKENFSQNFVF